MTRQATNKILELIEEGLLDKDTVIMACLKYMSEDEVADMAHANEFFYDEVCTSCGDDIPQGFCVYCDPEESETEGENK